MPGSLRTRLRMTGMKTVCGGGKLPHDDLELSAQIFLVSTDSPQV